MRVSQWRSMLDSPLQAAPLRAVYGADSDFLQERVVLLRHVLSSFQERFGDGPVRLFRAPGRINLRGMHVDTHGGYLNLMTHHREVVAAAAPSGSAASILANANPEFGEYSFCLDAESDGIESAENWYSFIGKSSVRQRVQTRAAQSTIAWTNYGIGAAVQSRLLNPTPSREGLLLMVDSDLPRGAALSSSAALSMTALLAFSHCNGGIPTAEQLIPAEQNVEWYAGARVGMSDQTAILLGRRGCLLHGYVFAEDFNLDHLQTLPFPKDLDLLVVNSHTRRNLSGAQRLQYALNRFSYSMAMTLLRRELLELGYSPEQTQQMDRLAHLTPETLGGHRALYRLLTRIPETLTLEELRSRYAPPTLDNVYDHYFGDLPPGQHPNRFPMRGPLLFGIAESERARQFPKALTTGNYALAGRLMTVGHDGDRVSHHGKKSYCVDISDAALKRLTDAAPPIEWQSGVYGASSPALDRLVDEAMEAGALGASLTGAGIAGAVLVLCLPVDAPRIKNALLEKMATKEYAAMVGAPRPAVDEKETIVRNHAVEGACEIHP